MIPHEKTLVKRLQDQPFALIGVNSDSEELYRERRPEMGVTWPSFFDGGSRSGPIANKWGVTGWPTIYVLDAEGKIRYKGVRGEDMDFAVDTLLAEMRGEPAPVRAPEPEKAKGGSGSGSVPALPLIPPARKKNGE